MTADNIPDSIDQRMWIRRTTCSGVDFLERGNPHTFPGRMGAFCPHVNGGIFLTISLDEILDSSMEARYFARGFIAGSEPGPPLNSDGFETDDENEYARWNEARAEYLITGYWPDEVPRSPYS